MAEASWNFGPGEEDCLAVADVLDLFGTHWSGIHWNDISGQKKVHEAGILRLDCGNAREKLKWTPVWNVQKAIERTALWYKTFYSDGGIVSKEDLAGYISDATRQAATWTL